MASLRDLPIPIPFEPMEAKRADVLPEGGGWRYEPKWDGFRCLAYRAGDEVELRAKSGKSLTRYFPDMVDRLKALHIDPFVIDGELIIQIGENLHFEALKARLHPAQSRVTKLASEPPADLVLFDCLLDAYGKSLVDQPLSHRLDELEAQFGELNGKARVHLSPGSQDLVQARQWLAGVHGGGGFDGVMAKRLDESYAAGERAMIKVKRLRTADCVVGGVAGFGRIIRRGFGRAEHHGADAVQAVEARRGKAGESTVWVAIGHRFKADLILRRGQRAQGRLAPTFSSLDDRLRRSLAVQLLEGALARRLVRPPAHDLRPVAEAIAGDVIVAYLHHQFRLQRRPFGRTLGAPAAGASGRIAGETGAAG